MEMNERDWTTPFARVSLQRGASGVAGVIQGPHVTHHNPRAKLYTPPTGPRPPPSHRAPDVSPRMHHHPLFFHRSHRPTRDGASPHTYRVCTSDVRPARPSASVRPPFHSSGHNLDCVCRVLYDETVRELTNTTRGRLCGAGQQTGGAPVVCSHTAFFRST